MSEMLQASWLLNSTGVTFHSQCLEAGECLEIRWIVLALRFDLYLVISMSLLIAATKKNQKPRIWILLEFKFVIWLLNSMHFAKSQTALCYVDLMCTQGEKKNYCTNILKILQNCCNYCLEILISLFSFLKYILQLFHNLMQTEKIHFFSHLKAKISLFTCESNNSVIIPWPYEPVLYIRT